MNERIHKGKNTITFQLPEAKTATNKTAAWVPIREADRLMMSLWKDNMTGIEFLHCCTSTTSSPLCHIWRYCVIAGTSPWCFWPSPVQQVWAIENKGRNCSGLLISIFVLQLLPKKQNKRRRKKKGKILFIFLASKWAVRSQKLRDAATGRWLRIFIEH